MLTVPTQTTRDADSHGPRADVLENLRNAFPREVGTDRRSHPRQALDHEIWLLDPMTLMVFRCRALNISETGLLASAPASFGLAVGQRYEVRIAPHVSNQLARHQTVSLGYVTVIRSRHGTSPRPDSRTSFAMRFDVPRFLPAL